jgi:threonyl-tRNA synthetase
VPVTFYHCQVDGRDAFLDLCRGPHVPSTGRLDVKFKLLSVAGAYWRGDEKNPMMQRVYAACFRTQEELDKHLHNLDEARRRDHRKLGKELKLFHFADEVGPGLPLWLPRGRHRRARGLPARRAAPPRLPTRDHAAHRRLRLYKTSGHWQNYRESMFPLLGRRGRGHLRACPNCPHHIRICKATCAATASCRGSRVRQRVPLRAERRLDGLKRVASP